MTFFFLVPSGKTPASRHPLFFCYTNFKDYSQLVTAERDGYFAICPSTRPNPSEDQVDVRVQPLQTAACKSSQKNKKSTVSSTKSQGVTSGTQAHQCSLIVFFFVVRILLQFPGGGHDADSCIVDLPLKVLKHGLQTFAPNLTDGLLHQLLHIAWDPCINV